MMAWHANAGFGAGSGDLAFSEADLDYFFPAHLIVDKSWRILATGPSLRRLLGEEIIGRDLRAVFTVEMPDQGSGARNRDVTPTMEHPRGIRLRGACVEREDRVAFLVGHDPRFDDTATLREEDFGPDNSARSLLAKAAECALLLGESQRMGQALEERRIATEAANRAKSTFLATMSHEIRTPMNGVLGLASLLVRTELTAEQRELVDAILGSGRALMDILNDVLDLSKIESGSMPIDTAAFHLPELLSKLEAMFGAMASGKGVTLHFRDESDCDRLRGDVSRIRQILLNLVGNAIKFTEAGRVVVTAAFRAGEGGRGTLDLTVADTGIGMAPAALDRIFQPFVQADSSTTRRFGGTGLGLAITRRLVDLMGGEISVESRLGIGTTFRVELPLEVAEAAAAPAVSEVAPLPDLSAERCRILLAEDNQTNSFLMTRFLARIGVAVDWVENGRETILAWEKGGYDIILMDVEMPVLDGIEATREIRRREMGRPGGRTGIIGLSAGTSAETMKAALDRGMDSFLTKPIAIERLAEEIQHILARTRAAAREA